MNDILHQPGHADGNKAIRLLVHGFTKTERQMLDAFVKLAWRHGPRIEVLGKDDVQQADAVIIDATDPSTHDWMKTLPWLNSESVIWVDANEAAEGSVVLQRPVQWYGLPVLLHQILERTSQTAAAHHAAMPAAATAHAHVLVVDDSMAVRSMLRSLLEEQGHRVTDVDNAHDALSLVGMNSFSCVLLDVLMPGMDGYEACRKIKSSAFGIAPPVVMLTSKSSTFDKIRGKMVGCDAYLTKPVEQENLLEVVGKFVTHKPAFQQQTVFSTSP